jgi:hypothetical protein
MSVNLNKLDKLEPHSVHTSTDEEGLVSVVYKSGRNTIRIPHPQHSEYLFVIIVEWDGAGTTLTSEMRTYDSWDEAYQNEFNPVGLRHGITAEAAYNAIKQVHAEQTK